MHRYVAERKQPTTPRSDTCLGSDGSPSLGAKTRLARGRQSPEDPRGAAGDAKNSRGPPASTWARPRRCSGTRHTALTSFVSRHAPVQARRGSANAKTFAAHTQSPPKRQGKRATQNPRTHAARTQHARGTKHAPPVQGLALVPVPPCQNPSSSSTHLPRRSSFSSIYPDFDHRWLLLAGARQPRRCHPIYRRPIRCSPRRRRRRPLHNSDTQAVHTAAATTATTTFPPRPRLLHTRPRCRLRLPSARR